MRQTVTPKPLADIILVAIQAIPTSLRKALFIGLFRIFFHISSRHRLIAAYNLRNAFPEKPTEEILRIARGAYRNLGIVAAEFFDIPRLTASNMGNLIDAQGLEHCRHALSKGRGVLLFSAHFGNWELEAVAISLLIGQPAAVIYRPLDSSLLDGLIFRVRSATGNTPIPKDRAMRPMLRSLQRNEILGILIDQNVACHEGVFVDYFGHPACTTDGLALLALHTEAPVLPAYMARLPDGRYRLVIGPEVEIVRTGNREADVLANTQHFTRIIEMTVRQYPDQWLWVHQRWKTQRCQARKKE